MAKREGVLAPLALVVRMQPDHEKQIRHCMEKWHNRTSGRLQWPMEGTFEAACCNEVEANIKHYKAKDTSSIREGKRAREREVLRWFRQAAQKHVLNIKQMPAWQSNKSQDDKGKDATPTAPQWSTPPPYAPHAARGCSIAEASTGQFPIKEIQGSMEGEVMGKITVNWGSKPERLRANSEKEENSPRQKKTPAFVLAA